MLQSDADEEARIADGDPTAPVDTPAGEAPTTEEPKGFEAPEGFEPEFFDAEKGVLLTDKVKERFDGYKKSEESYKKQVADLRNVISKGVKIPASIDEYAKDYKPAEEYAPFYAEEADADIREFLKANTNAIDEFSLEQGFSKAQNEAIKNMAHKLLADAGVLDMPIDEATKIAQEAENKKWIYEQYKNLGGVENVRKVISHYQNFNVLNEAEREAVMKHMDSDPVLISAMNKLRIYTHGEEAGSDIPVMPTIGGLADDNALAAEYNHKDTTDARRMEILQQRIASGRNGKLPLVKITNG